MKLESGMDNCIHSFVRDVITHLYLNANGGWVKPPLT